MEKRIITKWEIFRGATKKLEKENSSEIPHGRRKDEKKEDSGSESKIVGDRRGQWKKVEGSGRQWERVGESCR